MRRREFIAGLAGAAAWPLRAGAQPTMKGTRRIAIVHVAGTQTVVSGEAGAPRWRAFFAELRRRGYSEGRKPLGGSSRY